MTGTNSDSTPLRIAIVCMHTSPTAMPGSPDAGGMNVVVLNTALALAARGHLVDLVTRRSDAATPTTSDVAPGVRLHVLDAGPARLVSKAEHEALIQPFSDALYGWLRQRQDAGEMPDLVHSEHWFSGTAALPVTRALGLPHVQSFHSVAAPVGAALDEGEPPESPGRNEGERFSASTSDLVIAVSEAEKDTIVDRLGADETSVRVVYPGVNTDQFRPDSDEPLWGDGQRYLLFAARLEELKGADLALKTLAALDPQTRPKLVIAGEASPDFAWYEGELRTLATSLGIAGEILHVGTQDRANLARILRSALALINPSRSETYGLINLEASASGIPVIASRAGGMCESVIDGETGLLLTGRDPRDWASAVGQVLDAPKVRARLGAAGRAFALEHTWAQVAQQTETAYLEVLR